MSEQVSLIVGGKKYTGWETATLKHSVDQLPSLLTLTAAATKTAIKPGDEYQLLLGTEVIAQGWVDEQLEVVDNNKHELTIQARDKLALMADCTIAAGKTRQNLSVTLKALTEPFKLKYHLTGTDPIVASFSLSAQSPVDQLSTLTEPHNLKAIGNRNDTLLVMNKSHYLGEHSTITHAKKWQYRQSNIRRFNRYKVTVKNWWDDPTSVIVTDADINALRVYELFPDRRMTPSECRTLAESIKVKRKQQARALSITVAGWRDAEGKLWQAGYKVPVKLSNINHTFEIVSCTYSLAAGLTTKMELINAAA